MPKYSEEFKIKVVNAYLSNEGGTKFLAKKYNVARSCIRQWAAQCKATGKITQPTRHFRREFKLKVLNYQHAKGVQKRTLERSKEDRQRPKRDSVNYAVSMFIAVATKKLMLN